MLTCTDGLCLQRGLRGPPRCLAAWTEPAVLQELHRDLRSNRSTIRIWDWATHQAVTNLLIPSKTAVVKFSGGGLAGGLDLPQSNRQGAPPGVVKLWRTDSWAEIPLPGIDMIDGWTADLSLDGRLLAIGYKYRVIKLWTIPDGRLVRTLAGHPSRVNQVRFSPDGRRLASAGFDDFVKVWDVASGRELMTLRSHFTHTISVAFSPDAERLAAGGGNGTSGDIVKLWDLATQRELLTLTGGSQGIVFSPDGATLAARGMRSGVWQTRFWRTPSWQEIAAEENAASLR